MDRIDANYARLENLHILLMLAVVIVISFVEILQIKCLDNLIEQNQCFIKKRTKPMMCFKAFYFAKAKLCI